MKVTICVYYSQRYIKEANNEAKIIIQQVSFLSKKKGEDKPNTYYKSCHFVEEEVLSL